MRVAFVTVDTVQLADTARTRRLDRVARHVQATDEHEAVVCCRQWWEGDVSSFEQDGITYHRVTANRAPGRFATRLPLVLHRLQPDLVHVSYWPPIAAASAGVAGWLGRVPVVLDWYGDESPEMSQRRVRTALRRANRILTPSRHVETRLWEYGVAEEATRVIPESIDFGRIRSVDATDGPQIVTAREFDDGANIETMLLGLAELRDRDWKAVIVGEGDRAEEYRQQAADLRIADRITFPGWMSLDERIAHYKGAHVFVQTAEQCPFAQELLWGLACGCAGIVDYQTDSAAHELVEALDRGYLTTSSEGLSEAIIAAGDHDHREVNETFATYDHENVLAQYLDVYATLCGN